MADDNDDNTIDIGHRLPPIEVRKPWRQKLPQCYVNRIDDLKAIYERVKHIQTELRRIDQEVEAGEYSNRQEGDVSYLRKDIASALVLLNCAEEKIMHTVPMEELFMTPEELKEFWERPQ
jgi:hypothetical protein